MSNILYRFIVEIPVKISITTEQLWNTLDRAAFGTWLQSYPDEVISFANRNFSLFSTRMESQPLKFIYQDKVDCQVRKSNITYLAPLMDLQTLTYEDIEAAVGDFFDKYVAPQKRQFAVVSGDLQVWEKLFLLHARQPDKYMWMIPMPGEWHWTWHIVQGIFRRYYYTILLPFAKLIGFKQLDKDAKNFHYAEDFLQMVTIGIYQWIAKEMANSIHQTAVAWLSSISGNHIVYELAYACIHYFIPYWITRSALKWNRHEDMEDWWRYWVHLFHASGKFKYCLASIRFLMIMRQLHPSVKQVLDVHRVLSFTGDAGSGVPMDGVIELV